MGGTTVPKVYDALIRVSKMNGRKESAESTMTLADQEQAIKRAIREAGGVPGEKLEAIDESGFTIHRSDAYRQILERARAGRSNGVAVAYGDRLTRNWRAVGSFYDELEAAGAEVIIAGMPGVDYRTAAGRTMTGLLAVMSDAQYMTSKSRGDGIADATVARGVPNAIPYGYRRNGSFDGRECVAKIDAAKDGKALVPHPEHAAIVRRIFDLREDGHGWWPICNVLNDAGVPSPRGGRWTNGTVNSVIRNEVYTGLVKLGPRRLEDAHEALVSKAQWRRVQTARKVVRNGRMKAGLAGGLLVCGTCGSSLSVVGSSNSAYYSYGCRRDRSSGRCAKPVYVRKQAADMFVEELIRDTLDAAGGFQLVASARELKQLRVALEEAEAELEAFETFASARDRVKFARGYEVREQAVLKAQERYEQAQLGADEAAELPTSGSGWDELQDEAARRRVARRLIGSITVAPATTTSRTADITLRFAVNWATAGEIAAAGR